jgi:hypothetical protein
MAALWLSYFPTTSPLHSVPHCCYLGDALFGGAQGIGTPYLRGAGEGNDATQIPLRAIFSVDGVCTIRTVLKLACDQC